MSGKPAALVLWASNVMGADLMARAEAVPIGGFDSMSIFTADAEAWEDEGKTLASLKREAAARGGSISALDPYLGWYPGFDPSNVKGEAARMLKVTEDEVLRFADELEAPFLTLVGPFEGDEADFDATVNSLGRFTDRAAEHGVRPHIEIVPTSKVDSVAKGLALVEAVGRDNLGLLLDTYNMSRAGTEPFEIDAVPLERIFQIQLADAATQPKGDYFADAMHNRLQPGDGELDLTSYISRIAAKGEIPPIGPEIFSDSLTAGHTSGGSRPSVRREGQVLSELGADRSLADALR